MNSFTPRKVRTMIERDEGWGFVYGSRVEHYFRKGRSLCGKWGLWALPKSIDYPDCKACRKRLDKEKNDD